MTSIEAWVIAFEATALSASLRTSIWLYPIINTLHIIGLGMLLGAMTVLDLRLLGWRKRVLVSSLSQVTLPVAAGGLLIAVIAGVLLLIARPLDYIFNGLFQIKMGLLLLALVNVWWCVGSAGWRAALGDAVVNRSVRVSAALSLALWLAIIFAGRMVGYR